MLTMPLDLLRDRNMARPERFELPACCSGGSPPLNETTVKNATESITYLYKARTEGNLKGCQMLLKVDALFDTNGTFTAQSDIIETSG